MAYVKEFMQWQDRTEWDIKKGAIEGFDEVSNKGLKGETRRRDLFSS